MSHTFRDEQTGIRIHYNSDFSGDAIIVVAYWDATHPHAVDPDMDVVSRSRLVNQGAVLRRRDPIERLVHCAAAAAWIVTAYFVVSLVLSSTLHIAPVLFGLPTQPGIRIGDWAAWLSITAGLYSRSKSRAARRVQVKNGERP